MGPSMIHLNRDELAYNRFAQELSAYDKEDGLMHIKLIITDDDESIYGPFKKKFTNTDFMLCCNHLRKDILKVRIVFSTIL